MLDWRDPMVKRTFKLMVPVTLGLGLINVNAVIDTFFASRYINGSLAPTAIQNAFLIYMLPQGMFSVAIATVLFPSLSRLAARGDLDGFRETLGRGLRQIAFLLIPAAAVSAVLAEPIVRLLFQHGAWHPYETPVVADCLAAFSAGLVFNGAMLMLNRAFFSLQSNWIPTVGRAREPLPQRAARLRLLPGRHLGHPAVDRDRQHRRDGRADDRDAPADRRGRGREDDVGDGAHRGCLGRARRRLLRGLGPLDGCSATPSRRRSSRSGSASPPVARPTSRCCAEARRRASSIARSTTGAVRARELTCEAPASDRFRKRGAVALSGPEGRRDCVVVAACRDRCGQRDHHVGRRSRRLSVTSPPTRSPRFSGSSQGFRSR